MAEENDCPCGDPGDCDNCSPSIDDRIRVATEEGVRLNGEIFDHLVGDGPARWRYFERRRFAKLRNQYDAVQGLLAELREMAERQRLYR